MNSSDGELKSCSSGLGLGGSLRLADFTSFASFTSFSSFACHAINIIFACLLKAI